MASTRLTFHVPQEAGPEKLLPLLSAMYADNMSFPTVGALLEFAQSADLGGRTETQILATACGLLERDDQDHIVLSEDGKAIAQLKPDVRPDLIHYLLYTGWRPESPTENTVLWSYREVADSLWYRSSADVVRVAKIVTEEIRNRTQQVFFGLPGYESGDVSFSPKSIRGVRKWLEALTPPVIDKDTFSRRYYCSPELALLSIGWVARSMGGEIGIDLLLTPERREATCRLCLLDPSALDKVLDWMLPVYPDVMRSGTGAGVYGRFLHFQKWPEMADLI